MADGDDGNLERIFSLATEYVKCHSSSLDTTSLLNLYSRFKQAKEGPCKIPKPGFFDFQGKQKWEAWNKLGNMGRHQAMAEYIKLVETFNPNWQGESNEEFSGSVKPRKDGLGVAVSVMVNEDQEIDEDEKTVFDWCKEGNVKKVIFCLDRDPECVSATDDAEMTLLHWACDRGFNDIVELLLSRGAQINRQDADGQTALHYAVACEHLDVVATLLTHPADTRIPDTDGVTPTEVETSAEIKQLLLSHLPDNTQQLKCTTADGVS